MNFKFAELVQYALYGVVALVTLSGSLYIKSIGHSKGWFKDEALGGDGLIIWICLMMGLSIGISRLFRHLFGNRNSIL